jgi:hypothetical protein
MPVQISTASHGGSGTATPDLSIEAGHVDEDLDRMTRTGFPPKCGPVGEPSGVHQLCVRDPFGKLINILSYSSSKGGNKDAP